MIIDGYSQPGASPNTRGIGNNAVLKIELNGTNVGAADGLSIGGVVGVLVKGLAINRFKEGAGVSISNMVRGAWIQGNYIGTDATGKGDLGNFYGVVISSPLGDDVNTNRIGDGTPEARNVISGNNSSGVKMSGLTVGNVVQGNYIGTEKDGARALPNGSDGVTIEGAVANVIAGETSSQGNVIAFNGGDGIGVSGNALGNEIAYNSIFGNAGLGIDLGGDGVTPNDLGDGDTGANNSQNFPVLTSAKTSSGVTLIKGKLNSTANTAFTVRLFSNPRGSRDEGKKFIGEISVTTDANGDASFVFQPVKKVGERQFVTATATAVAWSFGETSEFSAPKKVMRRR